MGSPDGKLVCCADGFICCIDGSRELIAPVSLDGVGVVVPLVEGFDMTFPDCDVPRLFVELFIPVLSLLFALVAFTTVLSVAVGVSVPVHLFSNRVWWWGNITVLIIAIEYYLCIWWYEKYLRLSRVVEFSII